MKKTGTIFGAAMLVAGTTIGGGILAFPVITGETGFFPALILMLLGWAFMTLSALYLVEASLWLGEGCHILSITNKLLGPVAKGVAWMLYLFVAYTSLVGYIAGGGHLIGGMIGLSDGWAMVAFTLAFGCIFYLGNVILGRINSLLMIGLILAYLVLIFGGVAHINWHFLLRREWSAAFRAFPLLLTMFSFQTMVPSLTLYLNRDAKALKTSVILGTTIALVVYVIWECLILGTILYEGEQGLAESLVRGVPATEFLGLHHKLMWFGPVANSFAFFALVTSFLGIGLGLFDFLADALKISRRGIGSISLGLLVVIPSLFFALTIEKVFLLALDITGGIGDSILNCIFPGLMILSGRYIKKLPAIEGSIPGRFLAFLVIFYGIFVLSIELLSKVGVIRAIGIQ